MRKHFLLGLLGLVIYVVSTISMLAQVSFEARLSQFNRVAGTLDIDVEIKSTGSATFVLGTSTFVFNYSTTVIGSPTKVAANDGPWDNTDPDYLNDALSTGTGFAGLTVEFQGGDDNNGTTVPASFTRVGTVRFTILNAGQNPSLSWRSIGTVTQVNRLTNPGASTDQTPITSLGTFTVAAPSTPPDPPTLTSPANGSTNQPTTLTLSWNASSGATSYRLQLATSSLFTPPLEVDDSTLTTTSKSVGPLTNSTTYAWRVNAKNSAGTSAYSAVWIFQTTAGISPPPAPTLLSPPNGATNVVTSPTLQWHAANGATSYAVQVSEDSLFGSLTFTRSEIGDTLTTPSPLLNNTKYYWRVNASNTAGTGPYSIVWGFTTVVSAPATPTPVYPPEGALGVPIDTTLTWNPSSGATSYQLQVSTNSNFSPPLIVDDPTLTTTSKRVGPLNNNTQYFWHVRAVNVGGTSAYSATRSFTTILAAPTLVSPSDGATGVPTTVTLSWNPSSGATSYGLQVRFPSPGSSTVIDTVGLAATSFSVSGLANNTTYSWRVSAKNSGGTSAWSTVRTFTTIVQAPAAPTLLSPTNGATGVSINPTLSWTASAGAARYRLQVSTSSGFGTTVVDDSALTTTSTLIGPLTTSTQYFWHVSASNAGGTSAYSATRNFTTTVSAVEREEGITPQSFFLHPNYPNPFNPSTSITYDLPSQSFVTLKIYNAVMQEVATLVSEEQGAGRYRVKFDATGLASGIYFYQLIAAPFSSVKKMIFLR